jgi:hypothetical protein
MSLVPLQMRLRYDTADMGGEGTWEGSDYPSTSMAEPRLHRAWLNKCCGGDPQIRFELHSLLR